ncbi:MAG: RNA polymerase sigma-70 factor [Bacteroidota bacterium]|nr:RNA polymerase sigma-70 factor [Bacteroidota bacterium]
MPSYSHLPDQEVLQQMVDGDDIAFTEIYNRYWKKLILLAYSRTKDKFLAEEIIQEVFLSLWNRKESLVIESLPGYLATAIKFSVFKHVHNSNRRSKIIKTLYSTQSADLPEDIVHAKFLQEYIEGIVEQLPDKCRMVYLYSRKQGLTNPEICLEMGISEKTVEAHLTKALKVLRLNLKEFLILILIIKHF